MEDSLMLKRLSLRQEIVYAKITRRCFNLIGAVGLVSALWTGLDAELDDKQNDTPNNIIYDIGVYSLIATTGILISKVASNHVEDLESQLVSQSNNE